MNEDNKDNKRWVIMAITTVMIILIGSLGVNYVVNQQQKEKKAKVDNSITQEKDKEKVSKNQKNNGYKIKYMIIVNKIGYNFTYQ